MWGLLFFCLVALAACDCGHYDLRLNHKKIYRYKYEGEVKFGLGMPKRTESGVKMACTITITGDYAQTFILQASDVTFAEFNGISEESDFKVSQSLTEQIADQLSKPFKFDYTRGHVSHIRAAPEVSDEAVNIIRGVLDFLQVTVKNTLSIYELHEAGIHGVCQSNYFAEINNKTKMMNVTKVVDISNCKDKAAMHKGMAFAVLDKEAKQRGESVLSTVKKVYTIEPREDGGIIKSAYGLERQYFSPFNVKGGTFKMQAKKKIEFVDVREKQEDVKTDLMEKKGDLVHKIVNSDVEIPLVMQNLEDAPKKAVKMIEQQAEAHKYHINNATTEDVLKLYQLLRKLKYEELEEIWSNNIASGEQRALFLDLIVELSDDRILKFLQERFEKKDLSRNEALQTLLVAMNHLQANTELVEKAKIFLTMDYVKNDPHLWTVAVLSYGSLVYKCCAYHVPCTKCSVKPLTDIARNALENHNETEMVIALKALANAGHPKSIDTIMDFLPDPESEPGVAANRAVNSSRVLSAAVQSMRLLARKDPHKVQDLTMKVLLKKDIDAEIRMLAIRIMFDTKPSMALLSTLTAHLEEEKDLNLASFAYSYLKNCARSKTPDNHYLSTYCSLAVKILAPKLGHLSNPYSKSWRMDMFDDDFLMGTAAVAMNLRDPSSILPTEIMTKGKLFAIGRVLQLMEFGIRAEGIKELLTTKIPGFKGDFSLSDLKAVYDALKNWESLPNDKPVLSAYLREFGQEFFFAELKKDLLEYIKMAVSRFAEKGSPLQTLIENLQKGFSWHWMKLYMISEARYLQATTLGFQVEISKYYHAVSGINLNASAIVSPQPARLGDLLTSDISLDTEGFIGFTKDFWIFNGINTKFFQCGSELKSKAAVELPWDLSANINIEKQKFSLDSPTCKREFQLVSVSSNVYAVSRSSKELENQRRTPMIPEDSNSQVKPKPNNWHPKINMCSKCYVAGLGLCVESEMKRQYFHEEYPLYYLLGYTHLAVKVIPVQAPKPVERLHFEVNVGSKKQQEDSQNNSDSASSERGSHDTITEASVPEASINLSAFTMAGKEKLEGFDVVIYNLTEGDTQKGQLIVSYVGGATNWKMCVDTTVQSRVEANIKWGVECQPYEMLIVAAKNSSASRPALEAKVHWTNTPKGMADYCSRIESYIPGMGLLLGFNQTYESNVKQEVSATIVDSSSDSIDVILRLPKYSVSRRAVPFPVMFKSSLEEDTGRNGNA